MSSSTASPPPAQPALTPPVTPVPPEPSMEESPAVIEPQISRSGDALILEGNPVLPTDVCLKSGRPTNQVVKISLRNPKNPKTWFGKVPVIEAALCRKHRENHSVAVALTWSLLGVGAILLVVSALTLSFFSVLVGLVVIGISGVFRAASPVTSPDATEDYATIYGVSETVLDQYPSDEGS